MSLGIRNAPVFRQIYQDNIVPIQDYISVDFDNHLQLPVSFTYLEHYYEIIELLGTYPDNLAATVTFLVRTLHGVYSLCLDTAASNRQPKQWVLHYFVEENSALSEVDMLVEFRLKQIADFHGHLCPDLVIGYRAAQYALSRLEVKLALPILRVTVENNTSAVDAIQMVTGCTPGNQRLSIRDEGKHVYTFQVDDGHGLCLTLAPAGLDLPEEFLNIEQKIQAGLASLDETANYQYMLDQRILLLLGLSPETLFNTRWVEVVWTETPLSSAIQKCDGCGEPVIASHLVNVHGRQLCQRCRDSRKIIRMDG
jgi:formylmethanofuran dehydrogenase subunit E